MLNFFIVFMGGGLGSIARYGVSLFFSTNKSISTLLVNIVGCFLIAIVDSLLKKYQISFILASEQTRLLFIMGFLGGFTTYSSFLLDFFNHTNNSITIAMLYLFASIFFGLLAFMIGLNFAKLF